jgi:uncharacterized membrane protein YhaH (DUF805 family)
MIKFDGRIDRSRFLRAAVLRLLLFIASVIGFPFLLMGFISASGCAGIGGACGALGLVVSMAFKPLAFILLVFSFIGISMRRTRDAGLPGLLGLLIPLLLAANYAFFVYVGAPWSFAFSAGVLSQVFPRATLLALYCVAILCVMPSRNNRYEIANPFGAIGLVAFGLGLLIAFNTALGLAITFAGVQPWTLQLGWMLRGVGQLIPNAMIALAVALAWIAWQYRAPPDETAGSSTPSDVAAGFPPPPISSLLGLALITAVFACAVGLDKELSTNLPLALAVNMSSMVLPTVAIYFFLLFGLWLTVTRRTAGSLLLLVLALVPFLHWGYAHWTAIKDSERETAEIAAIPSKTASHVPATIVFESQHTEGMRGAWKVPEIERVISKGAYGSTLTQFERINIKQNTAKQSTVTSLPDEYLLLRVGRSSSFAKKGQNYSGSADPLELRYVDSSHDDLVAVWYRAFNPRPSMLPVLTTMGWYRGSNSVTTTEIDTLVGEFLAKSLKKPT